MAGDVDPAAAVPARVGGRVGKYEILDELGRGGMGVVYRARDVVLGRTVALKCAIPAGASDPHRRLLREARAACRLSHPHIVPVFDVFEHEGVTWMAMERIEGVTLRSLLADGKPLPIEDVLRFAEGLAGALEASHVSHVLHRDVTPNNVMVTADGRAVLTDFGLARLRHVDEDWSTQSRSANAIGGTPRYMSPEQALGKPLDERSDVFSFGAVLYEMTTGQPPFDEGGAELLDAILHRMPVPMLRLNYEVPEELERIVRKALAKDVRDRYGSFSDLLVDLRALRRARGGAAGADTGERRRAPWRFSALGLAVALTSLLAIGGVILLTKSPPAAAPTAPTPLRIGILLPKVDGAAEGVAEWPPLVQALAVSELARDDDLAVIDPSSLNAEAAPGSAKTRAASYDALRDLHAAFAVDSTISRATRGHVLRANLVDAASGEVRFSSSASLDGEQQLGTAVAALVGPIRTFLQLKARTAFAEKDLRPALARRPKNVEALKAFLQGMEYSLRYEPGAARYLLRALEIDPDYIPPRLLLISGLVEAGQIEEARRHYEHVGRLEGTATPFEQAMIGWAGAFIDGDKPAQARHLQVALEYSPGNNILLVTLGELRLRMEDVDGALAALTPPFRQHWRYPQLYSLYAASLLAAGRPEEARAALEGALDVTPVDPDTYGMLAALGERRGDQRTTENYWRLYAMRMGERGADAGSVAHGRGAHLMRVGLFAAAAAQFSSAVAAAPGRLSYHQRLAEALYEAGRPREAAAEYERCLAMDPHWPQAHLMLGRIAEAAGGAAEAIRHYEAFVAADPSSPAATEIRPRLAALRSRTAPLQ